MYATGQDRRRFHANPNGADAVAAATKAADAGRERTTRYLLATRLEQLREQTAARAETATPVAVAGPGPPARACRRPLDGGTAEAVTA